MHREISYCHLSGQDKGDRARKQPKKHQQTSDYFEHSGKADERQRGELIEHWIVRHVKQLGCPVLQV
jgi:hypothetical protein